MKDEQSIGHSDRVMLDLRDYPPTRAIGAVRPLETHLEIDWADGGTSSFHYAWFRENCGCRKCRNVHTLERRVDPLDIPIEIRPAACGLQGGQVAFVWEDGHESGFPAAWIWFHDPGNERNLRPTFTERTDWELTPAGELTEIEYDDWMHDDAALLRAIDDILDKGCTMLRGVPPEEDAIIDVVHRISFLRETHYGPTFHVRYHANPISGAFTNERLISHTDLPNFECPPGIQFFHSIRNDADGGDSVLVDGFKVANALRERAPEHYEALRRHALSYRLQDTDNDRFNRDPVIEHDMYDRLCRIRYSRTNLTPYVGSFESYPAVREAYLAFTRLVEDPRFEAVFKLEPGDCLITDNSRMLHGRKGFDRATGDRHLQGCYIDRLDAVSRKAVLERSVLA